MAKKSLISILFLLCTIVSLPLWADGWNGYSNPNSYGEIPTVSAYYSKELVPSNIGSIKVNVEDNYLEGIHVTYPEDGIVRVENNSNETVEVTVTLVEPIPLSKYAYIGLNYEYYSWRDSMIKFIYTNGEETPCRLQKDTSKGYPKVWNWNTHWETINRKWAKNDWLIESVDIGGSSVPAVTERDSLKQIVFEVLPGSTLTVNNLHKK